MLIEARAEPETPAEGTAKTEGSAAWGRRTRINLKSSQTYIFKLYLWRPTPAHAACSACLEGWLVRRHRPPRRAWNPSSSTSSNSSTSTTSSTSTNSTSSTSTTSTDYTSQTSPTTSGGKSWGLDCVICAILLLPH